MFKIIEAEGSWMAVVKEMETVIDQNLKQVFTKIETYFRSRKETTMESRELLEDVGSFKIRYKKGMASNGEVLTIHLDTQGENQTKINMVSSSTVEKTKYDWGKNERNMKLVLEQLGAK